MNRFFIRYLNHSGLSTAAAMVFIGIIDLFRAYMRHDRSDAIFVVIFFLS